MTPDRNPHAGAPITDDDATIAAALEDVSIPTLMLSMVHMTGDPSLIRGDLRPVASFLNDVQGFMSDEDKATVRAEALIEEVDPVDEGGYGDGSSAPGYLNPSSFSSTRAPDWASLDHAAEPDPDQPAENHPPLNLWPEVIPANP